ncbi:MAG: hypothetical protein HUU55_19160 [Myxococcales bacterium]|nr:hypothetical protein [Myxococcales bacterium]
MSYSAHNSRQEIVMTPTVHQRNQTQETRRYQDVSSRVDYERNDNESSGILFLTLEIIAGITCYVAANVFEPGLFSTGLVAVCAISMIVMAVAGLYSFWSTRFTSF